MPPYRTSRLISLVAASLLLLAGCSGAPERSNSIGEAFAGPATMKLRKDIDSKSPEVAVVHHGERLEITAKHRRWYQVRAKNGVAGWVEDRDLLDTAQMNRLKALSKETAGLPSQGSATTFDVLNVHAEPNKLAASFLQVKEGERFDVIAHRVFTREALPRRELVKPRRKLEAPKKVKKGSVPPPAAPAPPPLPVDWVKLSKERASVAEENLAPAAKDDWTLIRTSNGESGWVLTGRLYLAIPDEVAQYAEGHRITSYFSLGKIQDGDQRKDIWLWTTAVGLGEDHDFDGYRVFVWSLKHHRYETSFIQRREVGYFPLLAKQGEFSVCLLADDGKSRIRKHFGMIGNAVKLRGVTPCEKSFEDTALNDTGEVAQIEIHEAPQVRPGMMENLKTKLKSFVGK